MTEIGIPEVEPGIVIEPVEDPVPREDPVEVPSEEPVLVPA